MNDPFAGSVFVVSSNGGTAENLVKGYEGSAFIARLAARQARHDSLLRL